MTAMKYMLKRIAEIERADALLKETENLEYQRYPRMDRNE